MIARFSWVLTIYSHPTLNTQHPTLKVCETYIRINYICPFIMMQHFL